ncbi:MAG: hypothetical protein A2428_07665 [Bdellovibrionales bacterium RIFOXYC1_FULL_54_43]|nr:MAG: hypothetical protein A2428_07665 [Bdellovibrionales bacterium RIFOXYC1_FULL_54_43]OFZ79511.1 MAG: hypothetical protein A2603_09890 [Bdellovibrionales bacterium RIFOXYD1_FULL_55_31]
MICKQFRVLVAAVLAALIYAPSGFALINGQENSKMKGVIQLSGFCTGIAVGLNPLTVITARHCASKGSIQLPLKDSEGGLAEPEQVLFAYFYENGFDSDVSIVPGDIAVLIFSPSVSKKFTFHWLKNRFKNAIKSSDLFSVAPVPIRWGDPVSVCGFGTDFYRGCGSNYLLTDNSDFAFADISEQINEKYPKATTLMDIPDTDKIALVHSHIQYFLSQYGAGTRIGIGSFKSEALNSGFESGFDHDNQSVIPEPGDSGGPWYVIRDGVPHLIGVTSLSVREDRLRVGGIAWRIDHPWTVKLLQEAAKRGADIRGLEELKQLQQ